MVRLIRQIQTVFQMVMVRLFMLPILMLMDISTFVLVVLAMCFSTGVVEEVAGTVGPVQILIHF